MLVTIQLYGTRLYMDTQLGVEFCHYMPVHIILPTKYIMDYRNIYTVFDLISEHALISGHPHFYFYFIFL